MAKTKQKIKVRGDHKRAAQNTRKRRTCRTRCSDALGSPMALKLLSHGAMTDLFAVTSTPKRSRFAMRLCSTAATLKDAP